MLRTACFRPLVAIGFVLPRTSVGTGGILLSSRLTSIDHRAFARSILSSSRFREKGSWLLSKPSAMRQFRVTSLKRKAGRYHHGRLKEALISAGRALLEQRGLQGFT